jgi:anti-anti-sigma factor
MSIKTTLSSDGCVLTFAFSGIFDINKSIKIQEDIKKLGSDIKIIRIDCEQVRGLDSSVFSSLLLIYHEMDNHGKIELVNCDRALAHRFSLAGLDRLMTVRLSATSSSNVSTDAEQADPSKSHQ